MRPEGIVGIGVYWRSQSEREQIMLPDGFYTGALLHREYLHLIGSSLTSVVCVSEENRAREKEKRN